MVISRGSPPPLVLTIIMQSAPVMKGSLTVWGRQEQEGQDGAKLGRDELGWVQQVPNLAPLPRSSPVAWIHADPQQLFI